VKLPPVPPSSTRPIEGWLLPLAPGPKSAVRRITGTGSAPDLLWLDLEPRDVARQAARIREGREALLARTNAELVELLGSVGARFLDPADPLRSRALALLPAAAGLSPPMAAAVLDGMAADWVPSRLATLLQAEFEDPRVLERFVPARVGRGRHRALGDGLVVQILSGSVPGVSVTALIRTLLVRSATLIKPGRGDLTLPLLWLEGVREAAPDLANAVGLHYWPGGDPSAAGLAAGWLAEGDRVVVYGGEEAVAAARAAARPGAPVVTYPHRVSFGVVARECAAGELPRAQSARSAALAIALFDGRGCVTPQLIFVEEGGDGSAEEWAEALADALSGLEPTLPAGVLTPGEAAAIHGARGVAELRAAAGLGDRLLTPEGLAWSVIIDRGEGVRGGGPGRMVRVVPVADLDEIPSRIHRLAPHLQTAALAGPAARLDALAEALARAGVPRVTDFGSAPWPPPWWHHDGEGPLRALVRWTDREEGR